MADGGGQADALRQPSRRVAAPTEDIPALTGLRAVAALAVLVAHGSGLILKFQPSSYRWVYWLEQSSGLGMTLFFVLSGFVIHYNYRKIVTENRVAGVGWFIWARFARLYPLFLLILALDILLGRDLYKFLAGDVPNNIGDILRALPYYLTFTQSWVYVPLEHNSLIYGIGLATPLTWSISTEWFFYLCYPLFAGLLLKLRRPGTTLLAMAACCAVWVGFAIAIVQNAPAINDWAVGRFGEIAGIVDGQAATLQDSFLRWLVYFSPYARIGEFILGCLTCQLYLLTKDRAPGPWERRLGQWLTAAAIASIPIGLYILFLPRGAEIGWRGMVLASLSNNFGMAPTAALLIFCVARYQGGITRLLGTRPMVGIGEASYSIYLIHFPVLAMVASFLAYQLPMTVGGIAFQLARLAALIAIIVGVSLAVATYIEAPSRRWMRRLWPGNLTELRWRQAVPVLSLPIGAVALMLNAMPSLATPSDDLRPGTATGNAVRVVEATYGRNCGAASGNATADARRACDGASSCDYVVDVDRIGDPAGGCSKDFRLRYACLPSGETIRRTLPAEAGLGGRMRLVCPAESAAR